MKHQSFLTKHVNQNNKNFILVNWNVQNPSIQRAHKQAKLMLGYDVLVLTEVKNSKGCRYLRDRLIDSGYNVYFPKFETDYGVMIACQKSIKIIEHTGFLAQRMPIIESNKLFIIGLYVPPTLSKIKRKKFLDSYNNIIKQYSSNTIIASDLNVPYPDNYLMKHKSVSAQVYNAFNEFIDAYKLCNKDISRREFSLYRKKGYRPDNIFVTQNLSNNVKRCFFIDTKLSDHRMMILELERKKD